MEDLMPLQSEVEEAAGSRTLLAPWPLVQQARDLGLPLFTLLRFSTEGDNLADARELCDALVPWVHGNQAEAWDWQTPASWQSVYGRSRDISAY